MENNPAIFIERIELNLPDLIRLVATENTGLSYNLENDHDKCLIRPLNMYTFLWLLGFEVNYADFFAVTEYVTSEEIEKYGKCKIVKVECGFKLYPIENNGEINATRSN
jgi:hypothetical protein